MIDLNDYKIEIEGKEYVPFNKAVEALNELSKQLDNTDKLDEILSELDKSANILSNIDFGKEEIDD